MSDNSASQPDSQAPKSVEDPFRVLDLPSDADGEQVRRRYLELIRQYPPDREPEAFQRIHAAYQRASDPLVLANHLLSMPSEPESWEEALAREAKSPPRLSSQVLLSLGNVSEPTTQQRDDDTPTGNRP